MDNYIPLQSARQKNRPTIYLYYMEISSQEFTDKRRAYFFKLGLEVKEALKLHKIAGLWDRKEGKRDWGDVSRHCLVEVARVSIFADLLGLSRETKKDLMTAAALHDFFKKGEKEILSHRGLTWDSFEKSAEETDSLMRKAGFGNSVVRLVNAIGHGRPRSILEAEQLLEKPLSEQNIAFLVIHYVDAYTVGSDWIQQYEISSDGKRINDMDRRYQKMGQDPRLVQLNKEGKKYFQGESLLSAQLRVGHLVETKLADLVSQKLKTPVNPLELPDFIDKELYTRIASTN